MNVNLVWGEGDIGLILIPKSCVLGSRYDITGRSDCRVHSQYYEGSTSQLDFVVLQ
jgi:hypothetical protein